MNTIHLLLDLTGKATARFSLLGCLIASMATTAHAMFAVPESVPVDRLVRSAEAYLKVYPSSSQTHYTLGRVHYLAFHLKKDHIPAYTGRSERERSQPVSQWMLALKPRRDVQAGELSQAELIQHATKAMESFHEAVRLDPKNGLYQLGIASLLEEFMQWKAETNPETVPATLDGITVSNCRAAYAKAFSLAMVQDSNLPYLPVSGISSITAYEAAQALIRLAKGSQDILSEAEKEEVKRAEAAVAKFKLLKMHEITPMVFSFQPAGHLEELLDPGNVVDFDLRGYGPRERWPWVKPQLGFLVWDPENSGRITSARQMFGSYTFQIFRATGYHALAALDDNGDGALAGAELEGISVWFDGNSDGKSASEEVTPLGRIGVVSIATKAEGYDGIHPTHPHGLTLQDGRVLRTWDWMVEPVRTSVVKR
jgi:hypothetical protein